MLKTLLPACILIGIVACNDQEKGSSTDKPATTNTSGVENVNGNIPDTTNTISVEGSSQSGSDADTVPK